MKAYVLVKIRPGSIEEVVRNMQRLPEVVEANPTFGPYDAVAAIQADTIGHLGRLVNVRIQSIPGIVETLTCLVSEE
jgi:DNA-binding Lrp family transcriptional regulator